MHYSFSRGMSHRKSWTGDTKEGMPKWGAAQGRDWLAVNDHGQDQHVAARISMEGCIKGACRAKRGYIMTMVCILAIFIMVYRTAALVSYPEDYPTPEGKGSRANTPLVCPTPAGPLGGEPCVAQWGKRPGIKMKTPPPLREPGGLVPLK